jgi:predicted permease
MAGSLQQGRRGSTPEPGRRTIGRAAVGAQMSLSVLLIAGAFLFAFNLYRLTTFDTGVNRNRLAVVDVDAKDAGYKGPQLAGLNRRILERLGAVPGVESASFSGNGLYTGRNSNTAVDVDGFPHGDRQANMTYLDHVGPRYFTNLGTRLLAGRDFDEHDTPAGPRVAIVNQEFAKHFFNGANPVGKNIYQTLLEKGQYQIVGVVQDIYTDVRKQPKRMFYLPQLQTEGGLYTTRFVVRTRVDPSAMTSDLRAVDAGLRIESIHSADQLLDRTLDTDRLIAVLSFAFGLLAVVLAAVGIYGLLTYDVSRRTGEIGIRMALGATRPGVIALVFREVALVGALGIAAGIAAALALGKLVSGMVFHLTPGDPRVLACAIALLAAVAACAAWWPARRAASMDPMAALPHE